MTHAELDSATAQHAVRAANLLIQAFNADPHYLRKVELHAALRHIAAVVRDVMPEAGISLPERPDL